MRTPTPELIDAMQYDNERHEVQDRHVPHVIPGWERALLWGALIGTVVATIWRFSQK